MRILKDKKGIALAVVIMVFAVVSIIGTTVLSLSLGEIRSAEATEHTTKAYYLARSAVKIVISDIQDKYEALQTQKQACIDAANALVDPTQAQLDAAMQPYENALTGFNALNLIPTDAGSPTHVTVTIKGDDYPVTLSLEGGATIVSCTATFNGNSSTARAMFGTLSEDTNTLEYSNSLWDHALYSWKNLDLSGNFGSDGTVYIAEDGTFIYDNQNEDFPVGQNDYDMLVVPPPAQNTDPFYIDYTAAQFLPGSAINHQITLGQSDSGYYGALGSIDAHDKVLGATINWKIDTDGGDVVLVFDCFYMDGNSSITVTGNNNVYIFVKEPYTYTEGVTNFSQNILLSIANNASITSPNSQDNPNYIPQIYFITYDDMLQYYFNKYAGSTEVDNTVINVPSYKTTCPELDVAVGSLDIVDLANQGGMYAYFYLPFCNVVESNKLVMSGAVYSGNIDISNNTTIHYKKLDPAKLVRHAGTTVTIPDPKYISVDYPVLVPNPINPAPTEDWNGDWQDPLWIR